MSLVERVRTCHQWTPDNYRPFVVEGHAVGQVHKDAAAKLTAFPEVFGVGDRAVVLDERLGDADSRTAAVEEAMLRLKEQGDVIGWRGERYPVTLAWDKPPLLAVERAAVPLLGTTGYGVHVNGFVRGSDGVRLWVGRRSWYKQTAPGKLDHLVAGGQPHGLGIMENVVKEAQEEASVPTDYAMRARPVGIVSYRCEREEGLRADVLFCFDLEVPAMFRPQNQDGEVESFHLWTLHQVVERLTESDDFKFNVALVTIDFLVRHGVLTPDATPDYQEIVEGLRLPRS